MRASRGGVAQIFGGMLIVTVGLVGSIGAERPQAVVPAQPVDRQAQAHPSTRCAPTAPVVRPAVVVADTLESGSLRRWRVVEDGDAFAGVSADAPFRGRLSGRLRASAARTSRANVQANLGSRTNEVWAASWFRVDRDGARTSNVPTFRLFSGSARVADVFRQNVTGDLFMRTARDGATWSYRKLGHRMALGTWHHIAVHVRVAGGLSTIEISIDGERAYGTTTARMPAWRLSTLMIGSEHVRQVMDLSFDDVVIQTATPTSSQRAQMPAGWRSCTIASAPR